MFCLTTSRLRRTVDWLGIGDIWQNFSCKFCSSVTSFIGVELLNGGVFVCGDIFWGKFEK